MTTTLYFPLWIKVLVCMHLNNDQPIQIRGIAKSVGKLYSVVYPQIRLLEESGLVYINKIGNNRFLHLTQTGLKVAKDLDSASTQVGKW